VKKFRLSVTVPVERGWMIESAWVCALAATDLYAPAAQAGGDADSHRHGDGPLVDCLLKEAAGKPLPWFLQVSA
jgi:hypothetical protein